jgi:hypothetical protein
MATHSVEIINDAAPQEVVSINPAHRSGRRVRTEEEYVSLYRYLGSTDDADLARIARSRKVIFAEVRDGGLLRRLAARLNLDRLAESQSVPIVQLGGFSQWRRATHAVWAFRQVLDLEIGVFCIFDRDYWSDDEVTEFLSSATSDGLACRVLGRKEIENYLIEPQALLRAVARRLRAKERDDPDLMATKIHAWLHSATAPLKMLVMSQRAAKRLEFAKEHGSPLDPSTIIGRGVEEVERSWENMSTRLCIVPGKEVLSRLNEILQHELSVSLTDAMVMDQIQRSALTHHSSKFWRRPRPLRRLSEDNDMPLGLI